MSASFVSVKSFVENRLYGTQGEVVTRALYTVPNVITASGIIAIGVYIYACFMRDVYLLIGMQVLIIASDVLDGYLADVLHQHSRIGKLLDPARDRLHMLACVGTVWWVTPQTLYLLVMLCGIELAIGTIGMYALAVKKSFNVHAVGKLRSAMHWACFSTFLVQEYMLERIYVPTEVLMTVALCASGCALATYVQRMFFKR
jgi:phosphatidylglycerophosphate synthase